MVGYDIDRLKSAVLCTTLLEKNGWKVDLRESTPRAIKYRRGDGEIIIVVYNGKGWFDPTSEAKGDVLSLARLLGAPDFGSALKIVAELVGIEPAAPAWQRKSRWANDESLASRWVRRPPLAEGSAAWNYLTGTRGIPPDIIARVAADGLLREGPKGTIWAGHTNQCGRIVGWEERGPDWRGFSRGGSKTLFVFGEEQAKRLCIVEAAIDAMSFAALEGSRDNTLYASTGGGWSPSTVEMISAFAARPGVQVVAACDANDQGDRYAARLKEIAAVAGASFMRRWPEAEDWNDQLRQR